MTGRVSSVLGVLLLVALLVFGLYLWVVLSWPYSEGERAGILQKFSSKGWLCKTYEGELAISIVPGVTPVIWSFSVRDDEPLAPDQRRAGQARGPALPRAPGPADDAASARRATS